MGIPDALFIRLKILMAPTMLIWVLLVPLHTYAVVSTNQDIFPSDPSWPEPKKVQDTSRADYDGPHIFYKGNLTIIKQVLKSDTTFYARMDTLSTSFKGRHIICHINDTIKFSTRIKKSITNEPTTYPAPDKIFAISDIEGNFIAFMDMLVANGVMNKDFQWTFSTGHLVLNGDFFDRGLHVTECLWLIYHLEQEALKSGGYVHFILGNHEIMNMNDDFRYVRNKYIENTFLLQEPYENWFTPSTELGRWLQSKNVAERIGNYLFVHGGISEEIQQQGASLDKLNGLARDYYFKESRAIESNNQLVALLYNGDYSPFWYRGYINSEVNDAVLDRVLNTYKVNRIVVGHSLVEDVGYHVNGKVIGIDTHHHRGDSEALLVENGVEYRVDSHGGKYPLR